MRPMSVAAELLRVVYPGVCVALVGLEALFLTIFPDLLKKKWKLSVAIGLAFVLTCGEILVLTEDHHETEAKEQAALYQHAQDMKGIFGRFARVDQEMSSLLHNERLVRRTDNPLKERAFDLSSSILRFLIDRAAPPGYGQGGFGDTPFGDVSVDTEDYDRKTLERYSSVYKPQVATLYGILNERGLQDEQLRSENETPANLFSVKDIADRLSALANQLH
ncbi:MAG TPA: hypothetical protein VFW94_07830 [Candidatus Acidoferrales bacterium]|nr:hypothetical protein [Candidatus Acidoferrales bacterium]